MANTATLHGGRLNLTPSRRNDDQTRPQTAIAASHYHRAPRIFRCQWLFLPQLWGMATVGEGCQRQKYVCRFITASRAQMPNNQIRWNAGSDLNALSCPRT